MTIPNFLIIGAPRAGTTFLSQSLNLHPEICMPKVREVHFFDRNYDKGVSWYERHFAHCKGRKIAGEKTASYLVIPECAERIKEVLPEVKLITILRNPIDRLYSHYRNMIRLGRININIPFRDFVKSNLDILEMGNYYEHITRYLQYFGLEDIMILFFDELISSTDKTYNKILKFLGVDVAHEIKKVEVDNQAKTIYRIGNHVLSQKEINFVNSVPIINNILSLFEYRFKPIDQKEIKKLQKYYEKNNEKLFDLLNMPQKWIV